MTAGQVFNTHYMQVVQNTYNACIIHLEWSWLRLKSRIRSSIASAVLRTSRSISAVSAASPAAGVSRAVGRMC
eukprot:SAG22_NODE_345_length_11911_cov_15.741217_3_plen_73_part_00